MIRYFAGHPTAANLLMALLIIVGLVSLPLLRRETFPEFEMELVQATVVYPGATAEEVEDAICQRIEDAIDGLTDVEEVQCEAREGIGTATIEMADSGEIGRFLADVNTEIDAIDSFPGRRGRAGDPSARSDRPGAGDRDHRPDERVRT